MPYIPLSDWAGDYYHVSRSSDEMIEHMKANGWPHVVVIATYPNYFEGEKVHRVSEALNLTLEDIMREDWTVQTLHTWDERPEKDEATLHEHHIGCKNEADMWALKYRVDGTKVPPDVNRDDPRYENYRRGSNDLYLKHKDFYDKD